MAHTTYGTCLYLEFVKDSITAQVIIIPAHARMGDAGQGVMPPVVLHRKQDKLKNEIRQQWAFSPAPRSFVETHKLDPATSLFVANGSVQDAVDVAAGIYNSAVASHIESLVSAQFTLFKNPIVVQIGPAEIQAVDKNERPASLIERIHRARLDHGFPKELWADRYTF